MLNHSEFSHFITEGSDSFIAAPLPLSDLVAPADLLAIDGLDDDLSPSSSMCPAPPFNNSSDLADFCKQVSCEATLSSWEQASILLSSVGQSRKLALDGQGIGALFQALGKVVRGCENKQLLETLLEEKPTLQGDWRLLCRRTNELLHQGGFSVGNFVRVLWGASRVNKLDPSLTETLEQTVHDYLPRMSTWQFSVTALSCGHLASSNIYLWDALGQQAILLGSRCDATALSSIVRGFVIAGEFNQQVLYQFAEHAERLLITESNSFSSRSLAILLQSYSQSPISPEGLFKAASDALVRGRVSDLTSRDLSQIVGLISRSKCSGVEFSEAALGQCKSLVGTMTPRTLASLVWGLGSTRVEWSSTCNPLVEELNRLLNQCNGADITDIASGLSSMKCTRSDLFTDVLSRAEELIREGELGVDGAVQVAWSVVKTGLDVPTSFYKALAIMIVSDSSWGNGRQPTPETCTRLVQIYSKPECSDVRVLATAYRLVRNTAGSFSSGDLGAILFASSRSDYHDDTLADVIIKRICSRESIKPIGSQNVELLNQLLTTSVVLGFSSRPLLDLVTQNFLGQPRRYSTRTLSMLSWSAAQLNYSEERFWNKVKSEMVRRLRGVPQDGELSESLLRSGISVGWSLCGRYPEKAAEVLRMLPPHSSLGDSEQVQHHQARVAAGLVPSGEYPTSLRESMRNYCDLVEKKSQNSFEVKLQKVLLKVPELKNAQVLTHQVVDGIEVDFIVQLPVKPGFPGDRTRLGMLQRIVVEADGYYHFLSGDQAGKRRGCDTIQDRVFEQAGMKVIHISEDEFLSSKDKVDLFRQRLLEVLD